MAHFTYKSYMPVCNLDRWPIYIKIGCMWPGPHDEDMCIF